MTSSFDNQFPARDPYARGQVDIFCELNLPTPRVVGCTVKVNFIGDKAHVRNWRCGKSKYATKIGPTKKEAKDNCALHARFRDIGARHGSNHHLE
jgi:hypothetical protein